MMRARAAMLLLALLATAFVGPATAQLALTPVAGTPFTCPDANLGPCIGKFESTLIAAHPDIVRRTDGGALSIRLLNGVWQTSEDECTRCASAMDLLQNGRFVALVAFGEEDMYWKLLDRATGQTIRVEGYPLFSPDGKKIVSAERDEMNSNALDVYDVTPGGPVLAFSAIRQPENWAPREVCWANNATVAYERADDQAPDDQPGKPEALAYRNKTWRIETSQPARTDRCNGHAG